MVIDENELEAYLASQGVASLALSSSRQFALEKEWKAIYGDVWRLNLRHRHEQRAQDDYARQLATVFVIVPFLDKHSGPPTLSNTGSCTAAYECHGHGEFPDLSKFANLEFFVSPPDLSWTMVHTHEDHACGGPYFVRKEWLVPPTRRSSRRST